MQGVVPARKELLSTARELVCLTASCMGPAGRSKFLQIGTDRSQVVVTSSGLRLFGEACSLALYSAPAGVLVDTVTSQANCFGDGSLFVVNFACRLLVEALDPADIWQSGVGKGIGKAQVTREGFALALQWSLEYLNDPACPVRVPSFAQQGKSEENSTKTDETSAKPEEYFAESTFAKVPSLPQRESDDKNTANYAVGVSPPQGNSEEASAKYPVRAPLPQRKSGEIHAESTNDATTSAAAATTASGTEESEKRVMVALAVGVLSSKPVCRLYHEECRYLAELAVEAFHGARGLGDDGRVVSCVRLLPMLGPSCDNSEVIENAILLETPLPPPPCPRPFSTPFSGPHQPLPAGTRPQEQTAKTAAATATRGPRGWAALDGPVSVALFEASLQMETRDPFGPDADSGLQADFFSDASDGTDKDVGGSHGGWTVGSRELQELEAFARALVDVGVGIVACQRVIHPYLKRRLSENGVLPLERLSALNVASFQSVTGARLISSWLGPGPIGRADLGAAGPVTIRHLHGRSFLEVGSPSRAELASLRLSVDTSAVRRLMRPVSTLVLCAPDRPALDELQVTTEGLMRVLTRTTLEGGVALAGGGCWEVHLSSHLRQRAECLRKPPTTRPPPPTRTTTPPPTRTPPQSTSRTSPPPPPLPLPPATTASPPPKKTTSFVVPPDLSAPPPHTRLPPPPTGPGRRLSRGGRRRFDSPPPRPRPTGTAKTEMIAEPVVIDDFSCGSGGDSGRSVGGGSGGGGGGVTVALARSGLAGSDNGINSLGACDKNNGTALANETQEKWELKGQNRQEANKRQTKRHEFGCCANDSGYAVEAASRRYHDLASAVERFSSCLEASVCRRGEVAPFSPPSGGGGGEHPRHTTRGPAWGHNSGGKLLPSEVLQAVKNANGTFGSEGFQVAEKANSTIGSKTLQAANKVNSSSGGDGTGSTSTDSFRSGGGGGGGGGWGMGGVGHAVVTMSPGTQSESADDTKKREQGPYTGSRCDRVMGEISRPNGCRRYDHWGWTTINESEAEWRQEANAIPCVGTNDDRNCDGYEQSNCFARDGISRRLWGLDEEGQALKEVVRYGERGEGGSTLHVLSAEVLDGFASRVRGLESAVEACILLMLVEGAVYAND